MKTKQIKVCKACGGTGSVPTPKYVDGYLRYYEVMCERCDGTGVPE